MSETGLQMKYFVLKPEGNDAYAQASRVALRAYAKSIIKENPELAKDLMSWVISEVTNNMEKQNETI